MPALFQYWHDGEPPDYIADLIESFPVQNPDLDHHLFDESSAAEFIAASFGQREADCFAACAVPAMQADYFRYCALLACGGFYADVDYRCVGRLRPLLEGGAEALLLRYEGEPLLGGGASIVPLANSFLAFSEPGHPLLELTLGMASDGIERGLARRGERRGPFAAVFTTGPFILTVLNLAVELGSFEALRRRFDELGIGPMAEPFRVAAGDSARLARAFAGVRVTGMDELGVIEEPAETLPYKSTKAHWRNHGPQLFRSETAAQGAEKTP